LDPSRFFGFRGRLFPKLLRNRFPFWVFLSPFPIPLLRLNRHQRPRPGSRNPLPMASRLLRPSPLACNSASLAHRSEGLSGGARIPRPAQNGKGGLVWEPPLGTPVVTLEPGPGSFFSSPACLPHIGLAHPSPNDPYSASPPWACERLRKVHMPCPDSSQNPESSRSVEQGMAKLLLAFQVGASRKWESGFAASRDGEALGEVGGGERKGSTPDGGVIRAMASRVPTG